MARDEFSAAIKDTLAKRVGFRCSNPGCRQATSGPQEDAHGVVNVGVAAHITAASAGGPRYNPNLDSAERGAIANGIWLCQTCAKLVDSDETAYSVDRLRDWKRTAEATAADELESRRAPNSGIEAVSLEAWRIMPDLLGEMRDDLAQDASGLVREFVALPNRNCIWNPSKPRFTYYQSEHENLILKIDWLMDMGLVTQVQSGDSRIYRMTTAFAQSLQRATA